MPRRLGGLLFLLPLITAVAFVVKFGSSLPLTDEWTYTHALRVLDSIHLSEPEGWTEFFQALPLRHSEHWVIVPFFLYWPVAELFHMDSRWVVGLTLVAFGLQALAYARVTGRSRWALLPVVLLLYCPSHYMEFLWGWQITLTLSALFPLLGLVVLDRISHEPTPRSLGLRLGLGITCMVLGTLSSAGGFFGFPAAVVLLALQRSPLRTKIVPLLVVVAVGLATYFGLMHGGGSSDLAFGLHQVWLMLTAIGATLVGSPVGLLEFGFDLRSALGFTVGVLGLAVIARAIAVRQLDKLALPISMAAFGLLCLLPIAMVRHYLGNWHVQYALPVVIGGYLAGWTLWQHDQSRSAHGLMLAWTAVLASCLWGYAQGFRHFGPTYRDYTARIEAFVWDRLTIPGAGAPYPAQNPDRDLDLNLILFLSAKGNPLFTSQSNHEQRNDVLPEPHRFLIDGMNVPWPTDIASLPAGDHLVTIALPRAAERPVRLELSCGSHTLRLWRVHAGHVSPEANANDWRYYSGLWLESQAPEPGTTLRFHLVRSE